MQYCSLQHHTFLSPPDIPQLGVVSTLAQPLYSSWSYFPILLQWHIGHLPTWVVHLSVSYLSAFSYCSLGFQGMMPGVKPRYLSFIHMKWELDHKESWGLKNWCFWTMVLQKTLESPLDCKEIQPAHPKGNQSWIFIGRTDVEAETPILWLLDAKSWFVGKTLMLGNIEEGDDRGWDG